MNPEQQVERKLLIEPQDVATAGAVDSTVWVLMDSHRAGAVVGMAHLAEGEMATFQLRQATDDGGTGAKDVTGKSAVLTGGSGGSDEIGEIEFNVSDLDIKNDFKYASVQVTTTGAGDDVSASLELHRARYIT